MAKSVRGIPPDRYAFKQFSLIKQVIDTELLELERQASKATPVNTGNLKNGWFVVPFNGKQAVLGQSKNYYLPVELGRKPGKGISEQGQRAVARWAKLKLGIVDPKDAKSFAYLLSEKYKARGRQPQPILGLNPDLQPQDGGLLDRALSEIDRGLNRL